MKTFGKQAQHVRAVMALSAGLTLLVAVALGSLGWRLVSQERALERQRQRDRLEQAADGLTATIMRRFAEVEAALAHGVSRTPPAALSDADGGRPIHVRFERATVHTDPPNVLLYVPAVDGSATFDERAFLDADRLEFVERDEGQLSTVYTVDGSSRRAYTLDLGTKPVQRKSIDDSGHASVINPSWSPDGRQLAYAVIPLQNRSACRLMVRELASGKDRAVLNWEGGLGRGASWSPDGQSVIIVRNLAAEGGINRVDKVNVTTGSVELIAQILRPLAFPRMSPDGRYLYLLIASQVERVDLQTRERANFGAATEPTFDLSADGKRLVLVVREAGALVLKVLPTDGGESRTVLKLRPDERVNSVAWKPGSDALFLAKRHADAIQLFELDTRTASEPLPLPAIVTTFADISVHPDGRQLAFLDADWLVDFWRIDGLSEAFAAAVRGASAPARVPSRPRRTN